MKNFFLIFLSSMFMNVACPAVGAGGNEKIDQATSAFSSLNFERALKLLEQAFSRPGNGAEELTRIYSLGALCLVSLGKMDEAKRSFEAVLSIDPSYRLGEDASPRFQKPFLEVLKKGVPPLDMEVSLPSELIFRKPVSVRVKLLADPAQISKKIVFYYKHKGQPKFSAVSIRSKVQENKSFYLPPGFWDNSGMQPLLWYAQLQDRFGGVLHTKGSATDPVQVKIIESHKNVSALSNSGQHATVSATDQSAWYEHWWVWAMVGTAAAIAAGSTAAIYLGSDDPQERNFTLEIK